MAKNFFDSPWSWIAALLTGFPFPALRDIVKDKSGMNATDREYIAMLKRKVESGEMSEEEARAILGENWHGDGSADDAYDSVDSSVGEGMPVGDGSFGTSIETFLNSIIAYYTRNELTGAEREMNAFSAGETQLSRNFTEYMARNKYQMETQSMQDAGVNPALVYGGGNLVPTAANGAAASSSSVGAGNIADLMATMVRMPLEMKRLQAEIEMSKANADKARKEGDAAAKNADTNARNAETNAQNASTNARLADIQADSNEIQRMRVGIEQQNADNNTRMTDANVDMLARQCAILDKQYSQMDSYLAIAAKNADSQHKSAIASLQQAAASARNAATNEKLSDYQATLMRSQAYVNWANGDGQNTINKYLDETQKATLEKIKAEGWYVNQQGKLCDKQGKLLDAQATKAYLDAASGLINAGANAIDAFIPL